jgi:hypothetical protein
LLESSLKINDEFYKKIKKGLFDVGRYTGRFGTVGEPFPIDVKIKTIAEEKAKELPKGSTTEKFYIELVEKANGWIKETIIDDEERFED